VVRSVDKLTAGRHDPAGGILSVSKQIRPWPSMFGSAFRRETVTASTTVVNTQLDAGARRTDHRLDAGG
jgi:hypothetical protein